MGDQGGEAEVSALQEKQSSWSHDGGNDVWQAMGRKEALFPIQLVSMAVAKNPPMASASEAAERSVRADAGDVDVGFVGGDGGASYTMTLHVYINMI